jgi:uncharacterized protein
MMGFIQPDPGRLIMYRKRVLLLSAVLMGSCLVFDRTTPASDNTNWRQVLESERRVKDTEFGHSALSPLAGVSRYSITDGKKAWLESKSGTITISGQESPDVKIIFFQINGAWQAEIREKSIRIESGGSPYQAGSNLPAHCSFVIDRLTVALTALPDKLIVQVFDSEKNDIRSFKNLVYFEPNPAYAVSATMEKFTRIEKIKMLTSRSEEKTFYRFARITFTIDGKPCQLTAYKTSLDPAEPDSRSLFIPFGDPSNGKETYHVGRFLDVGEPTSPRMTLDFNRAYNPLCNYSEVYNCPIPPPENILTVTIPAGEKSYPRTGPNGH